MSDDGGSPGSGKLSVIPEKVHDVGRYVYEVAEALRTALDSAAKDVDSLARGSWTGDYADEFADGWTDVRDGGVRILSALTGLAEKLGVTADTYQSVDTNNAAGLNTSSLDLP
ncbi:WXG100 family type VII secretion target [Nocardia sp. CA-135953]|uniref:WXG100 family type VII secretion target n=1 Tax=Nocardia sp. CA-135953 TaxID=3239978 RepID=UPI003D97CBC8